MEQFTLILTIPAAFVFCTVYVLFLVYIVRPYAQASLWLWWSGAIVLGCFAVELMLVATVGVPRTRALLGAAFHPVHLALFVGGTPALANLLILRQRRAVAVWACAAVFCCTMLAFGSVVLQYALSEALYGSWSGCISS